MKYLLVVVMVVIACSAEADTHHGKLTFEEAGRILAKQEANYDGRYDEDLTEKAKKAESNKQKEGKK